MSKCNLHLENYVDHYKSGETIIGHVECNFTSDKEIYGIFVGIKGTANTQWSQVTSYNVHTLFQNFEEILKDEIDLLENGGEPMTMQAGVYRYPFSFTLPVYIPSTFKSNITKIEYSIKAVVKRPLLQFNMEAESKFVVVTPVDLSKDTNLINPACRTEKKTSYLCCFNEGDLLLTAKIPRTGIAVGERLPVHILVQNQSNTKVDRITCKLIKKFEYVASFPYSKKNHERKTIYKDHHGGVGPHGDATCDMEVLVQDASLVANYIECNVLHCRYDLQVICALSGLHTNLKLEIPVMIGHVPIAASHCIPVIDQPPAYNNSLNWDHLATAFSLANNQSVSQP